MMVSFENLMRLIEESGYFQNYLTFGEGNVRPWDWDRAGRLLSGRAKLLWDAFLCGKEVSRAQFEKAISKKTLALLVDRGLCSLASSKATFGLGSLINSSGFSFFVSRGSLAGGYFGEDSKILMSLRPYMTRGRVLCLYSGTGAEILGVAATGAEPVIEAEESMHSLIATNLELNGIEASGRVVSPKENRSGGPYDLIMARVPSFVEFGGIKFPALLGGGADGNEKWSELLQRARKELSDSGRIVFLGVFYGSKKSDAACEELESLFKSEGFGTSINIGAKLSMEIGIPVFNQTLATAEICARKPRVELLSTFEKELESHGHSHAYLVKGLAWKSRKGASGNILNLSEHYYGTWLT